MDKRLEKYHNLTLSSVAKTKEFPVLEWRGEIDDGRSICVRYNYDGSLFMGIDARPMKAEMKMEIVATFTPSTTIQSPSLDHISNLFKWVIPKDSADLN